MPMWQSEALWISFDAPHGYPFAVKIAAGKINAVDGKAWSEALSFGQGQDFLAIPRQPWLDGFAKSAGADVRGKRRTVSQFVAMPLGGGYTVEEQMTGKAEHGGLQIIVYPLRAKVWEERKKKRGFDHGICFEEQSFGSPKLFASSSVRCAMSADMGLGKGGSMFQEIYEADEKPEDWDTSVSSKCFVAIANSLMWQAIAGEAPPTVPPTATDYARQRLPWFDYYSDAPALGGSPALDAVKTVGEIAKGKGETVLPENEGFDPVNVPTIKLGALPSGAKPVKTGIF